MAFLPNKFLMDFLESIDEKSSKIIIAGISGAGKSTIANKIHYKFQLPYTELDSLFHGENWIPKNDYREKSLQIIDSNSWVVDSIGYQETMDELWYAATHIIWLDLPLKIVIQRVLKRSLQRTITNEKLFNGNKETIDIWFTKDHPLWTTIGRYKKRKIKIQELLDNKQNDFKLLHITEVKENNLLLKQLNRTN